MNLRRKIAILSAALLGALAVGLPAAQAATQTVDSCSFTYSANGWAGSCTEHWSTTNTSTATVNFTAATGGSTVSLKSMKAKDNGIEAISVDGGAETLVDLYTSGTNTPATVWTSATLAAGGHTLKVRATGTKNSAATGYAASVMNSTVSNGTFGGSGYTGGGTPPPTNTGPTSAFSASTLTVSLDASASSDPDGTVTSYGWDFGDAATGTGKTVTHTYAAAGTYTVKLTVTDDSGTVTVSQQSVTVNRTSVSVAGTAGGTPPPAVACNDGVDNDGDGLIDYPADPGCTSATDTDETDAPPGTSGNWVSGGTDADSSFGDWRGSPQESASTWQDNQSACENQWELTGEFDQANWSKPLVNVIGGKWSGYSWAQAASGALDSSWSTCLNAMKGGWGTRPASDLYISLFHEANGNWYSWSVTSSDLANFKAAFHRFRVLQQQIIPGSHLMFSPNADQVQGGYSVGDLIPDPADYDDLGVDIYSMHDVSLFDQFPALAAQDGKDLVVQEWGTKNDEQPGFVQAMHDKFVQYGGTGPGHVVMENYFNLNEYQLEPSTTSPNEAAVYRSLW